MIDPEQAAVVMRIFEMYANGMGLRAIAVQLNGEGVPGPNGVWSRYTIHEMLRNERYRGVSVWGRTKKGRDPESGRKVSRPLQNRIGGGWKFRSGDHLRTVVAIGAIAAATDGSEFPQARWHEPDGAGPQLSL